MSTSQCPDIDAANNGDWPISSHKLISALLLSKNITTLQCPSCDAKNSGDCPKLLRKLIPLNVYLVLVQISICVTMLDYHHCLKLHTMDTVMLCGQMQHSAGGIKGLKYLFIIAHSNDR
jgi:hypothetical protein